MECLSKVCGSNRSFSIRNSGSQVTKLLQHEFIMFTINIGHMQHFSFSQVG